MSAGKLQSSKPLNQMRFVRNVRRVNIVAYSLALVAMCAGACAGACDFMFFGLHGPGILVVSVGLMVLFLVVERFVLLRWVKCPACGKPFFVYTDIRTNVQQLPLVNHACLHCHALVE